MRTLKLLVRLSYRLAIRLLAPVVAVAPKEAAHTAVEQKQLATCDWAGSAHAVIPSRASMLPAGCNGC